MKKQINNYTIDTKDLIIIFPPKKYVSSLKLTGATVIEQYDPMTFESFANYMKRFWRGVYNHKYMIVYEDPDNTTEQLIKKAVSCAFKKSITVFFRELSNCKEGFTPQYTELIKQNNIYHSKTRGQYEYMGSYYTAAPEKLEFKVLSNQDKEHLKRYIKYYDITYPETEYDWYLAKEQIDYYLANEFDYGFDSNLYYICEQCGDLVRRDTEHVCYCDIPYKRTKLEYLINGEV